MHQNIPTITTFLASENNPSWLRGYNAWLQFRGSRVEPFARADITIGGKSTNTKRNIPLMLALPNMKSAHD
ncbi:hypothetical protein SK128_007923 [Halocaridina rubra]|uniref:Uncharacterized protein n=1 Tax=Halocaridina rubra TaxID=373956 RepID=A0AAN8WQK1_HALRR